MGKGGRRWYKDVGLGFRTPKTAIEGNYIGMKLLNRARKKGKAKTELQKIIRTMVAMLKRM